MKSVIGRFGIFLLCVSLSVATINAAPLPAFSEKNDGVLQLITIPTLDISVSDVAGAFLTEA